MPFLAGGKPNVALIIGLGLAMMCLTFWLVSLAARGKLQPVPPRPGQLLLFRDEVGRVGVAKVLAYAEELVHLRVYSNRWSRPPRKLPISDLFISRSPDVEDWGSQHVIMPFQQYQRTMLKPLDFREVVDEELIEYREWVAGSSQRLQNDEIKLTRSDG